MYLLISLISKKVGLSKTTGEPHSPSGLVLFFSTQRLVSTISVTLASIK